MIFDIYFKKMENVTMNDVRSETENPFNIFPSIEESGRRLIQLCKAEDKLEKILQEAEGILQAVPKAVKVLDKDGCTLLHLAAANDKPSLIELLLQYGAKETLHVKDKLNRYTPLYSAITRQSYQSVDLLIKAGAEVNVFGKDKMSPLHVAVQNYGDHGEILKLLLNQGASITVKDTKNGHTPLHHAATIGDCEVLTLLLSHCQADMNIMEEPDKKGQQLLHIAVAKGHSDCVNSLLEYGAKVDAICKGEKTSLHIAAENKFHSTCERLLYWNADVNVKDSKGNTPLMYSAMAWGTNSLNILQAMLRYRPNMDDVNDKCESALHLAAKGGCSEKCRALVESGIACDLKDNNGMTALHHACKKKTPKNCAAILGINLDYYDIRRSSLAMSYLGSNSPEQPEEDYQDLNMGTNRIDVNIKDKSNKAPIHYALENNTEECCRLLLMKRANVLVMTNEKDTPLHLACKRGMEDSCKRILLKGGLVNETNVNKQTALHLAARAQSLACCQMLIKSGASVSAEDSNHMTPLHCTAEIGNASCCTLLVQKKANLFAKDSSGRIPLFLSASEGHLSCCEVLLTTRPHEQILIRDKSGDTSFTIAFKKKHDDVFCYLLWKGLSKEPSTTGKDHPNTERRASLKFSLNKTSVQKKLDGDFSLNSVIYTSIREKRRKVIESILRSELWEGSLAPFSTRKRCTVLQLLIRDYPDLALIVLDRCILTRKNGEKVYLFYHLEDTYYCMNEGEESVTDSGMQLFTCLLLPPLKEWALVHVVETRLALIMHWACTGVTNCVSWLLSKMVYQQNTEANDDTSLSGCLRWTMKTIMATRNWWVTNNIGSRMLLLVQIPCRAVANCYSWFLDKYIYPQDYQDDVSSCPERSGPSWVPFTPTGHLKPNAVVKEANEMQWRENHPLHKMVKYKRLKLLKHPLCQQFLKYKWNHYIAKLFYCLFFVSAMFVATLSFYVMLAYDWDYMQQEYNLTQSLVCGNKELWTNSHRCSDTNCETSWFVEQDSNQCLMIDGYKGHPTLSRFAILLLLLNVGLEIFKLRHLRGKYLKLEKWVQAMCYVTAVILLPDWTYCTQMTGVKEDWQWACGAMSVLLAWFDLTLLLGMMPHFGVYLFMLNDFLKTVLKFVGLIFLQVIAFSVAFHMLMRGRFAFSNFPRAIMKITTMMLGDLGYDDLFNKPEDPLPYPTSSNLLLVCFLALMCVGMLNLITNFPQGEMDKAKEQTQLINVSTYVNMILDMESMYPMLRQRFTVGWHCDKSQCHEDKDETYDQYPCSDDTEEEEFPSAPGAPTSYRERGNDNETRALLENVSYQIRDLDMNLEHRIHQYFSNRGSGSKTKVFRTDSCQTHVRED